MWAAGEVTKAGGNAFDPRRMWEDVLPRPRELRPPLVMTVPIAPAVSAGGDTKISGYLVRLRECGGDREVA